MVLGTPSYMSPEQLSGKKVDGRSDIFSLGVTLYQLLTGSLPFQADSMATLMFKIANEPHPPAATVRPDLPGPLGAVIDRALAKDLDKRYARGTELAADLRAALRVQ
jgi:serine/threonine protein kinase